VTPLDPATPQLLGVLKVLRSRVGSSILWLRRPSEAKPASDTRKGTPIPRACRSAVGPRGAASGHGNGKPSRNLIPGRIGRYARCWCRTAGFRFPETPSFCPNASDLAGGAIGRRLATTRGIFRPRGLCRDRAFTAVSRAPTWNIPRQ
jgi:hypothetical protein